MNKTLNGKVLDNETLDNETLDNETLDNETLDNETLNSEALDKETLSGKILNRKIFCYELRRMLLNRLFLGMLLVNGIFAWCILDFDIIMGAAYTAPFSPWSYGAYLGKVMPMAVLTLLLLLSGSCGRKQRKVEILTSVTPVSLSRQLLLRTAALGVCFVVICVLIISIALVFYLRLFDFHAFSTFILPTFLLLPPCFMFFAGLGQLLGRFHQGFVFALMLAAFLAGYCGVRNGADLFGAGYFNARPLMLPLNADGEPDFMVDAVFVVMRGVYLLMGALFLGAGMRLSERKGRRA